VRGEAGYRILKYAPRIPGKDLKKIIFPEKSNSRFKITKPWRLYPKIPYFAELKYLYSLRIKTALKLRAVLLIIAI